MHMAAISLSPSKHTTLSPSDLVAGRQQKMPRPSADSDDGDDEDDDGGDNAESSQDSAATSNE